MKVFLSHKMNGLTKEQVKIIRVEATLYLKTRYGQNIEIIDNYNHKDVPENAGRLWHLGTSIKQMEEADAVYFCKGHCEDANGCKVERMICELYGLKVLE